MKKTFITCLLLFAAGILCALDGGFIGVSTEASANTREGAAFTGGLAFGLDLSSQLALGLKTSFSHDFDAVAALEPLAFLRWYPPLKIRGLFLQAEAGAVIFFEHEKAYPAPCGGLAAGWRFNLGSGGYIELSARGGYPYIWGAGLGAGVSFNSNIE